MLELLAKLTCQTSGYETPKLQYLLQQLHGAWKLVTKAIGSKCPVRFWDLIKCCGVNGHAIRCMRASGSASCCCAASGTRWGSFSVGQICAYFIEHNRIQLLYGLGLAGCLFCTSMSPSIICDHEYLAVARFVQAVAHRDGKYSCNTYSYEMLRRLCICPFG